MTHNQAANAHCCVSLFQVATRVTHAFVASAAAYLCQRAFLPRTFPPAVCKLVHHPMGKGETSAFEDFLLFCCSPRASYKGSKAAAAASDRWRVGSDGLMELSTSSSIGAHDCGPKVVGTCNFVECYRSGARLEIEATHAAPDVCIKDCCPPVGSDVLHVIISGPLRCLTVNACKQIVVSAPSCTTVDTVHCSLLQLHLACPAMLAAPSVSLSHCSDIMLVLPPSGSSGHIITSHTEGLCFTHGGVASHVVSIPCEFGALYQVNSALNLMNP